MLRKTDFPSLQMKINLTSVCQQAEQQFIKNLSVDFWLDM